jgi:hypothetical protein
MAGWYDTQFFDSIMAGSRRSAEIVLGRLAPLFEGTPAFLAVVVPENRPLADWYGPLWRRPCALSQRLPAAWVLGLARLKRGVQCGLVLRMPVI